eukprot:NODE_1030_length_1036_cov_186.709220_g854_i0.p1 GENE.NODE_1030_length_1036_cov_186.709220_g854_i0~~NODE_1030_length_1036_cov_186.709220_g854_i0.p1  ORF type:complete len:221 (+),score=26.73 NODE_1030_length_1036_cov_186.709220_g854_i0:172-834(+)
MTAALRFGTEGSFQCKWDTDRTVFFGANWAPKKRRWDSLLQVQTGQKHPKVLVAEGSWRWGSGITTFQWFRSRFASLSHMHTVAADVFAGVEAKFTEETNETTLAGRMRLHPRKDVVVGLEASTAGDWKAAVICSMLPTLTSVFEMEHGENGMAGLKVGFEKRYLGNSAVRMEVNTNMIVKGAYEWLLCNGMLRAQVAGTWDPNKSRFKHGFTIMCANPL